MNFSTTSSAASPSELPKGSVPVKRRSGGSLSNISFRCGMLSFILANLTYAAFSVLNTFKAMVTDGDFLEKEDVYILNRIKEFLQNEEVSKVLAVKQLLSLVERAVSLMSLVWSKLSDAGVIAWRRF